MPEVILTQEVEVTGDVSVYCANCGAGLCNQTTAEFSRGNNRFYVEPCKKCLDNAYRDGYDKGIVDGERGEK